MNNGSPGIISGDFLFRQYDDGKKYRRKSMANIDQVVVQGVEHAAIWRTDENRKPFLKIFLLDEASKTKIIPLEEVPDSILRKHAKTRGITGAEQEMFPHPQRPLMDNPEHCAMWFAMNRWSGFH